LDLLAIFILANFVCLLSLMESNFFESKRKGELYSICWVLAVFVSFCINALPKILPQLQGKKETGQIQELNTHEYLATGLKKGRLDGFTGFLLEHFFLSLLES